MQQLPAYLPLPEMDAKYKTHFNSRNVIPGCIYDLAALIEIYNYREALEAIGFIHLLNMPDIMYPILVCIFYSNATSKVVEKDADNVP